MSTLSCHRTSPVWGYIYKDLIAAQSELQKNQKTVQYLMSKLEVVPSFPPRVKSSETMHKTLVNDEEKSLQIAATNQRPNETKQNVSQSEEESDDIWKRRSCVNSESQSELGTGATISRLLYTEDNLQQLITDYIVCAQKIFPEKSMLLLQAKMSTLLYRLRTNLPKVTRDACAFLFPDVLHDVNLNRYWSNLQETVQAMGNSVNSSPTAEDILREKVRVVVHDAVSQVSLSQDGECATALFCSEIEIELLLEFISRMYPGQKNSIKTMLYNLDFHGYDLLSILSAIYVHFLLATLSEVGFAGDGHGHGRDNAAKGLSMFHFLEWVSLCDAYRLSDLSVSKDMELLPTTTDYFERNFEFKLLINQSIKIVMVPVCLKQFFVASNNGMFCSLSLICFALTSFGLI